ncbi:MAG: EAL domain-containing protein [Burkholderiales bacterium]
MRSARALIAAWYVSRPVRASLALAGGALLLSGLIPRLDNLAADFFLSLDKRAPDASIVIVEIDGASLDRLGRWPWSRAVHAQFVERATLAGAAAIGFDIAFAEPDARDARGDKALVVAIARSGRVVLPTFFERDGNGGQSRPLPLLANAAARLGSVDVDVDQDGVVRRISGHSMRDGTMAFAHALSRVNGLRKSDETSEQPSLKSRLWIRDDALLVPFGALTEGFHRIAFADVLSDRRAAEMLRDRTVIVGVTAPGLARTFMAHGAGGARTLSGVELQAHLLDAINHNALVRPVTRIVDTLVAIVAGMIVLVQFAFVRAPRWATAITGATIAVSILATTLLLLIGQVWLSPALPVLLLAMGYIIWWWLHSGITARSLDHYRSRFEAAMQSSGDALVTVDAGGTIIDINHAAEELFSRTPKQASGAALTSLLESGGGGAAARLVWRSVGQCVRTKRPVRPEENVVLARADSQRSFRLSVIPIDESDRRTGGPYVVVVLNDVTRAQTLSESISYLATHDALTALPNRAAFMRGLDQAIVVTRGSGIELAVVVLELAGFTRIDHTLGPSVGDRLMQEAARRLEGHHLPSDLLGHWDRAGFGIVIQSGAGFESTLDRIKAILASFGEPFLIDGRELVVSACAGVARFPSEGNDAESLIRKAGVALRRIRKEGGSPLDVYSENNDWWGQGNLELQLELGKAIERNELVLYYQPQVAMASGRVVGFEALLRWHHPRLGLLGANRIVPVAEASDLIITVGEWVMDAAARQLAIWRALHAPHVTMSVNVSARQLMRADMPGLARRVASEYSIERGALLFELTESLLMRNPEQCERVLAAIRHEGIGISIDDFGTGYSSLAHLNTLPIDQIKIDQSFICTLPENAGSAAIVEAVITMARSLGLSVIAEGVESEAQLAWLRARHCDKIQGHFYSRAVPADQVLDLITAIEARTAVGQAGVLQANASTVHR